MKEYEENWREIPGYEGIYMVSDYANVKSLDRISHSGIKLKGKQRVLARKNGVAMIGLCKFGITKTYLLKELVAMAFLDYDKENPDTEVEYMRSWMDSRICSIQVVNLKEETTKEEQEEIWTGIPKYKNYYQVSNLGRVRELNRVINNEYVRKGSIIEQFYIDGVSYVSLYKNHNTVDYTIDELKHLAFKK